MKFPGKIRARTERNSPVPILAATLFMMYIISGLLLLLLALLLYKVELSEAAVRIGVIVIYIITGLIGGFFIGKRIKDKKYLWGLLAGTIYFLLLLVLSAVVKQGIDIAFVKAITTLILCGASGMAGGMVS